MLISSLPAPPRLEGPLQANSHLLSAERLYEGKLLGPESIVREGGKSTLILNLHDLIVLTTSPKNYDYRSTSRIIRPVISHRMEPFNSACE